MQCDVMDMTRKAAAHRIPVNEGRRAVEGFTGLLTRGQGLTVISIRKSHDAVCTDVLRCEGAKAEIRARVKARTQ